MNQVKNIIQKVQLKPHPEGGYFKETYRSEGKINQNNLGSAYVGKRDYSTCIYFLLTSGNFSAFHKIKQDEIWHFYKGSPIKLHIISELGEYSNVVIGNDLNNEQTPQFVVSGGNWFAAEVVKNNDFSLVGCTVSPGFDFTDFELGSRKKLIFMFSQHQQIIYRLTND